MKKSIIFFIISVWILTGCGGGGSDSNSISQNSKEYPPANLLGETERDYIIKNAKIFIKSPNGDYKKETLTRTVTHLNPDKVRHFTIFKVQSKVVICYYRLRHFLSQETSNAGEVKRGQGRQ